MIMRGPIQLIHTSSRKQIGAFAGKRHFPKYVGKESFSSITAYHEANPSKYIPDDIYDLVHKHAKKPQTSVSLQNLMRTGQGDFIHLLNSDIKAAQEHTHTRVLIQIANFLRRELPVRLAHRIVDLDSAPFFRDMPSVHQVLDTYIDSFVGLLEYQSVTSEEEEEEFALFLSSLYDNHSNILIQMARGAYELREAVRNNQIQLKSKNKKFEQMDASHDFLDRFYMARIGIRVLAGQYLSLRQQRPEEESHVGLIDLYTSPYDVVRHAAEDAELICCRKYGDAPSVNITGRLDLTFPYIPSHLHYILLELLKNSMRATVDFHGVDNDFPEIEVIIADGKKNEDVVIKVEDKGGGIPRSDIPKIWSYLFTTADPVIQEGLVAFSSKQGDHSTDSPLAGLGYGLPISRSYARYFGGDVSIMSMEGYGTDAFIYLRRLGDSKEPLHV